MVIATEEKLLWEYLVFYLSLSHKYSLPWWLCGKEPTCQCRRCRFNSWVRKIPWRRKWQPTPVFLPGESHGQRSLVGYSPWGCKESDTTEQLNNRSIHGHLTVWLSKRFKEHIMYQKCAWYYPNTSESTTSTFTASLRDWNEHMCPWNTNGIKCAASSTSPQPGIITLSSEQLSALILHLAFESFYLSALP